MPRSNAGIYTRPVSSVNPPVAGIVINGPDFDASQADIAAELTNSLDRLGRGPMQAVMQMGGFVISNVGTPVAQTDAATLGTVSMYVPSGAIMDFAMSTPPAGWLVCDGSLVSRVTYASLFAAIGTTWGAGDGSTTFQLPDLRTRARVTSFGPGYLFANTYTLYTNSLPGPSSVAVTAIQTCIRT